MDSDLRKGLSEARQLIVSGEIVKGLSKFAHLIDLWPNIFTIRLELAEVLISLRWKRQAAEIFEAAARYFCQAGFPLMAIYALKRLGDVDPELIDSPMQMLISTYEYGSKKIGNFQITDYPSFSLDYAREIESLGDKEGEWISLLTRMATDLKDIKNYPKNLPVIPILSSLNQENFDIDMTICGEVYLISTFEG